MPDPVSYTHLDVYKRQVVDRIEGRDEGIAGQRADLGFDRKFADPLDQLVARLPVGDQLRDGDARKLLPLGESHGPAIGCVIDGCPPRIPLTESDIQPYLDRRRPGQSRYTSQRQEPDAVKILSGVFVDEASGAQVTTGAPIALLIDNVDQRSKDYSDIKDKYRPGHADYTYDVKYGLRDYRGGGRQSARETATRVAAGAIARKIVPGMQVRGALVQLSLIHI